jgi:hypothetical protein
MPTENHPDEPLSSPDPSERPDDRPSFTPGFYYSGERERDHCIREHYPVWYADELRYHNGRIERFNDDDTMVELTATTHTHECNAEYGRGDTNRDALEARPTRGDTAGCGSGRLITYQAESSPNAFFLGVDVDVTCTKMTAINLALLNVDGHIVHGDALTHDNHQAFDIHHDPDRGGLITHQPSE